MDKMVSIKGLVIRTTPVIPDMKTGMEKRSSDCENVSNMHSLFSLPGVQSCRQRIT